MNQFFTRRDGSANNVPVVAYNESVDCQDVVMYGVRSVKETKTTSALGKVTLSHNAVSNADLAGLTKDETGIVRGRDTGASIVAHKTGSTTTPYYVVVTNYLTRELTIYSDKQHTTAVTSQSVDIIYNIAVPVQMDNDGKLIVSANVSLPEVQTVTMKSGEVLKTNLYVSEDLGKTWIPYNPGKYVGGGSDSRVAKKWLRVSKNVASTANEQLKLLGGVTGKTYTVHRIHIVNYSDAIETVMLYIGTDDETMFADIKIPANGNYDLDFGEDGFVGMLGTSIWLSLTEAGWTGEVSFQYSIK